MSMRSCDPPLSTLVRMRYLRNFRYVIPHSRVRSDILLTRSPLAARLPRAAVRLACVRHAASVQSEPGSNSSVQSLFNVIADRSLTQNTDRPLLAKCLYFFFVNI